MSYARYDFIVDGIESVDASDFAGVYRILLPLGETAYEELGRPQRDLTTAVQGAIQRLREVPVIEGDIALKPVAHGNLLLYEYADPKIEALSAAQKHLLRMGPRNVARVQAKLRELARELDASPAPETGGVD
jgi:hypothetical protein